MKKWTWGEIKSFIKSKHDLENEEIDEPELIQMCNSGINLVEAKVVSLQQDYFLAHKSITIDTNESEYELPDEIYATKIRRINATINNKYYHTVKQLRDLSDIPSIKGGNFKYKIFSSSTGRKMKLFPTPVQSGKLDIYYTRNANRIELNGGDSQICDIPEFIDTVLLYMTMKVYEKDMSPMLQFAREEFRESKDLLTQTLSKGINDEDNEILPDLEFYEDITGGIY